MDEGIAAAAQTPPASLRKVRRLQSVFCIVITDQLGVKDGALGHDESGIQSAQRLGFSGGLNDRASADGCKPWLGGLCLPISDPVRRRTDG